MIIDQLPEISTVQETDEIPVERGTTTYKSTLQKLKDLMANVFLLQSTSLNTSHNITVPNASAHLLLEYGGALDTYRIFWVAATSGGILDVVDISSGSGSTISRSGNVVTITYTTARFLYLIDIPVFGGACSI